MGCRNSRKEQTSGFIEQKWDYINLADFKSKGCGVHFAYGYLWFSLLLSTAVYGVDSFTAVQLLAFNRWSSKIEPAIPFSISKWIFSVCILLSFVNLIYEGIRAIRIMKRGNVADCYLDSLAVRWESIRLGSGQGYKRFLAFTELTKSKKGAEYVALFTYFSFQSWIRVIFCMGPRQVVNALTLRSVYIAKLAVSSATVEGSIAGFFDKIKALAEEDYQQALILSSMCFTLVIWIFSALYLIMAALFYVFFLLYWIPRADGSLTRYCERKVNDALLKIVKRKVNTALAKGEADRIKAAQSGEKMDAHPDTTRPTLPNVGLDPTQGSGITASLVAYASRPETPENLNVSGEAGRRRPMNSRSATVASKSSYSSRAPLVSSAAEMAYGRPASPALSLELDMRPPSRPDTASSQRGFGPRPGMGHMQQNENDSTSFFYRQHITQSPAPKDSREATTPFGAPARSLTSRSTNDYNWRTPAPGRYEAYELEGRSSPAPAAGPHRPYQHQQPTRSLTSQPSFRGPQHPPPPRTRTAPPAGGYYDRSGAPYNMRPPPRQNRYDHPGAPQGQSGASYGYGYDVEAQKNNGEYY